MAMEKWLLFEYHTSKHAAQTPQVQGIVIQLNAAQTPTANNHNLVKYCRTLGCYLSHWPAVSSQPTGAWHATDYSN